MQLFLLGATGGTGTQLTVQALARGHTVTAFVRSAQRLHIEHERLRVVQGDPRDAQPLGRVLLAQDVVLSALGAPTRADTGILEAAARSTILTMRDVGVRRLVAVSMALLFPDIGPFGPPLRFFLRRHLRDSAAMEQLVESSELDWTVARPSRLTNGRPTSRYQVSERHAPPGFSISRADLARAILDGKGRLRETGDGRFKVRFAQRTCKG
jgi:putative NADH-flavin reductase